MEIHLINSSPYDANAYLINAPRPVLIDPGMNAGYVREELALLIDPDSIGTIILTHGHYDHWGAADELSLGADIAIHAGDAAMLKNDLHSAARMFGSRASLTPDRLLRDGDLIDLGDGDNLRIIHTPGHTPGSICLYHQRSGTLFSGDTVFSGGGFGRTDLAGGDQKRLVGSLEKLAALEVKVMYPGHGPAAFDGAAKQILMSLKLARTYL